MDKVPILSFVFISIAMLISFAIPVVLFFWFRKRKKADILPFFIGMAVFFVFAMTLESLMHQLVLNTAPGKKITANIYLYALYGGLAAGIFEEAGRYLAFRFILRKHRKRDINALMYGAGHGGCEAAMVFGSAMINNLIYGTLINLNQTDRIMSQLPDNLKEQMESVFSSLITTKPYMFFVGLVERFIAVPLQLALSVLVFFAVKKSGKWYLFPLAILLHALVDGILVIASKKWESLLAVYGLLLLMVLLVCLVAFLVWKRNAGKTEEQPIENQPV